MGAVGWTRQAGIARAGRGVLSDDVRVEEASPIGHGAWQATSIGELPNPCSRKVQSPGDRSSADVLVVHAFHGWSSASSWAGAKNL
jgi:hypothetical protein